MSAEIDRTRVVQLLRGRGDDDAAARAEDELPERFDPDDQPQLLMSYGVDAQDLDDQETVEQEVPTGLGSGQGSGLGHSMAHEPEPLLDDGESR